MLIVLFIEQFVAILPSYRTLGSSVSLQPSQPRRSNAMEPRLNFYKANPEAMKALGTLEQHVAKSGLEKPLVELVRLRASQINGCAFCIDMHSSDALKAGEQPRRLAALSAWHETPFFTDRERAALTWT